MLAYRLLHSSSSAFIVSRAVPTKERSATLSSNSVQSCSHRFLRRYSALWCFMIIYSMKLVSSDIVLFCSSCCLLRQLEFSLNWVSNRLKLWCRPFIYREVSGCYQQAPLYLIRLSHFIKTLGCESQNTIHFTFAWFHSFSHSNYEWFIIGCRRLQVAVCLCISLKGVELNDVVWGADLILLIIYGSNSQLLHRQHCCQLRWGRFLWQRSRGHGLDRWPETSRKICWSYIWIFHRIWLGTLASSYLRIYWTEVQQALHSTRYRRSTNVHIQTFIALGDYVTCG